MSKIYQQIANALDFCDFSTLTNVPGSNSTSILEEFSELSSNELTVSFNEEVAYGIALGSAITGRRAATVIKTHGLAKAANAAVDSLSSGITAAMLVIVVGDETGRHSDSILPARDLIEGLGLPGARINIKNINESISSAIEKSEMLRLPVAIYLDVDELEIETEDAEFNEIAPPPVYERNLQQFLVGPVFASYQRKMLEGRMTQMDTRRIEKPALPRVPDDMPEKWKDTLKLYSIFFVVYKPQRGELVAGDTGIPTLFALPPYDCIDICTYMGGSLPLAIGAYQSGYKDVWAITGDFSFIAAGHMGLIEAKLRGIPLKVVIFKNDKAQTTGGHEFNSKLLWHILEGWRENIIRVSNPQDKNEINSAINKAKGSHDISIIVLEF